VPENFSVKRHTPNAESSLKPAFFFVYTALLYCFRIATATRTVVKTN